MLLLNLLGIFAVGSFSVEVTLANDDLDDTLKQALFLVKLLKSDFAQILRTNDEVVANSTEDENSTCSLPSEKFNTTMAMNETAVTVNQATPSTPAMPSPSTSPAPPPPPASPTVVPPGAPMMMPYATWPPMAMGYPPLPGPGRQNFPDENYRFPYRPNRRRMMPDYYYFDSPVKSRGNFRRFGNDPTDDLVNTPATSQAQTTSSLSSTTSEATTLNVEETTTSLSSTASTTSLSTTASTQPAQPSTSILPTTEQAIIRTTISANHTILTTAKQSIPAKPSKQKISTIAKPILLRATSTKQSSLQTTEEPTLPTIILSTRRTKHRKRVRHKKRVLVSKATTTVFSNRNKNHLNVSRHHLRHHTHNKTTTEKWTKDDFEMSQVASELEKELQGTNTENMHASSKESDHLKLKKLITATRTTTTMKVFLQRSSRIPVPFPENNGFCHYHPENALCGAI